MYFPCLSVVQQNGAAPLPQALDWFGLVGGGGAGLGGWSLGSALGAAKAALAKKPVKATSLKKCMVLGLGVG